MADFYQHARLPTLHQLAVTEPHRQDADLIRWTDQKPIVLLLPALYAEFQRPALPIILEQISLIPWIAEVVLSANGMQDEEHAHALQVCRAKLRGKPLHLLWNDGPAMVQVHEELERSGSGVYEAGKGSNIWSGLAYLQARGHKGIVISHDTDIMGYTADLPRKLAYPLAHPQMPYRFAKGYYSRVAGRLYGRVTRLLIFPLLRALSEVLGEKPLLQHLESYRYPLSGEFAADMELLSQLRLPSGWGLEVAMLCECQRLLPIQHQCQVDMGFHYEHRHRPITPRTTGDIQEAGLVVAAEEVACCLFDHVFREAEEKAPSSLIRVVVERYHACCLEWLDRYEHVALINGLEFDREDELATVSHFEAALGRLVEAGDNFGERLARHRSPPACALSDGPVAREALLQAVTVI